MFNLLKKLNGKTFTVVAVAIAIVGVTYFYGCESRTYSLTDSTQRVNRSEIEAEIALFNARANARIGNLDQQDKLKKMLIEQVSVVGTGGAYNPVGVLNSVISILAVGYAADSRKKLSAALKHKPLTNPV